MTAAQKQIKAALEDLRGARAMYVGLKAKYPNEPELVKNADLLLENVNKSIEGLEQLTEQPTEAGEWEVVLDNVHGLWAISNRNKPDSEDVDVYYTTSPEAADRLQSLLNASERKSPNSSNLKQDKQ